MTRVGLKLPAQVWKAAIADAKQDDYAGERGKIEARTLHIWGDQDGLVPRSDQDAQTTGIRDSRLVVYPGAGHVVGRSRNASHPTS